MKTEPTLLKIEDLTFSYGQRQVLKNVNVTVAPGETIAITGPSGSGKSTLLALSGLLIKPVPGQVWHWGKDMGLASSAAIAARRRRLRFIFQRPYLLRSLTVLENVMTGALLADEPDQQLEKRARGLLDILGLADLAARWPEHISGGQQQRVALARAVIGRPDLLLADEPTASLDFASAMIVIEEMRKLAAHENCGIIITTHDLRITTSVSRRYQLNDGLLERNWGGPRSGSNAQYP